MASCVETTELTRALHHGRFSARRGASSIGTLQPSRSRLMTSYHRVRGAPRGLFQPAVLGLKSRMERVGCSIGRRWMWPYHRRRRWTAWRDAGGCCVRSLRTSLEIRSYHLMFSIVLRDLLSKPSILVARVLVKGHVSAPYGSIDRIAVL